jgi:hypoxanthine phosphoribosyltransferase
MSPHTQENSMPKGNEIRVKELKPVFTQEQIAARVRELAAEIDAMYGDEPLVVVCVLKGAVMFFSDLVRSLHNRNLELDFVRLSSYGRATSSSKHVIFNKDLEIDICDKHVLIVEDIVDSGHSMRFLLGQFAARRARSLRLATMVDKGERREIDVPLDFVGFTLKQGFIVGYGLDYAERYRMLPGIYEIVPE